MNEVDATIPAEDVVEDGTEDFIEAVTAMPVQVVVKRKVPRADLSGYDVGQVVASVTLAPGWDLNTLVDHIRDGWCGEG